MAIDPNIILSGNQMAQPRLPDVNAMMQTRTAGLENTYDIEQARAEQAKTAQKEQEAALVEALAPAYATAFKGGGTKEAITAAYNLLPPEIQSGVKGQIDRLLAMPSDDLRLSALEASMAGSEMGRTLLVRIPTKIQELNAQIQQGQLRVAEKKLAMEESQLGMPKPISAADQARIDLETRRVELAEQEAARKQQEAADIAAGKRGPTEAQKGEVWNPEAGRYDVVPGTKLYRESSAKHAADYKAKTAVQDRVAESLAKIDYILAPENKDGFEYNFGGYYAAYAGQYMPIEQAQNVGNNIESLKSDITQAGLELMRSGGAIGAITEREWPLLERQIAAVTPYVGEQRAREILQGVAQRLKNIQARATEAYDTQWGETQFYKPSDALPTGAGSNLPEGTSSSNW